MGGEGSAADGLAQVRPQRVQLGDHRPHVDERVADDLVLKGEVSVVWPLLEAI